MLYKLLKRNFEVDFIMMILFFINSAYIGVRQYLFSEAIANQFSQAVEQVMFIAKDKFPENSEQFLIFSEMMDVSTHFYLSYSPGMWIAFMMLCLLIGYFIVFRKNEDYVPINQFQVHIYVCYITMFALGISLLPGVKLIGVNLLIAIMPLFLIQGMAVANQKMINWFSRSMLLKVMAIICIIINPYVVLFLSIIGLFDNWLDFRKIYKEEKENSQDNFGGDE